MIYTLCLEKLTYPPQKKNSKEEMEGGRRVAEDWSELRSTHSPPLDNSGIATPLGFNTAINTVASRSCFVVRLHANHMLCLSSLSFDI